MGVDHRRSNVPVAEKFLDGSDVVTRLQKSSGERVAQAVATSRFGDSSSLHRGMDGPLQDRFVQMVASQFTSYPLPVLPRRRKYPLPHPLSSGARVFGTQRTGKLHEPATSLEVCVVLPPYGGQMLMKWLPKHIGKQGQAVLLALAAAYNDLSGFEVQILDSKARTFEQT
jgi:hypothetical protein